MILNQDENNFLKSYSRDDYTTFRKRFVGIILATDMARHVSDLGTFKSLVETNAVKEGNNITSLFDSESVQKEFEGKQ